MRKKAFSLRFLEFPGAVRALRKRAKMAEKRANKAESNPHLVHLHLRQPN